MITNWGIRQDSGSPVNIPPDLRGLIICKAIIDAHHGQICIDSRLDEGTRVTVTFLLFKWAPPSRGRIADQLTIFSGIQTVEKHDQKLKSRGTALTLFSPFLQGCGKMQKA
jgi:hypothetical protein